jgi:fructoselysine and glucoselysine-specific PTS system IIA component
MEKTIPVRKFLIATHGAFAAGIRSSLDIIIGKMENVFLIQAYLEENKPIEEELSSLLRHRENEEWVIFSDLLGGSITNQILRYANEEKKQADEVGGNAAPKIHIVAGFNLPLLIEIMLADEESPMEEIIENAVSRAKDHLVYVNKLITSTDNEREND